MELPDKGSDSMPWVGFSNDPRTGISIIDGELAYLVDGKVTELYPWMWALHDRDHLDYQLAKKILGDMLKSRGGVVGWIMRKIPRGG